MSHVRIRINQELSYNEYENEDICGSLGVDLCEICGYVDTFQLIGIVPVLHAAVVGLNSNQYCVGEAGPIPDTIVMWCTDVTGIIGAFRELTTTYQTH